MAQTCRAKESSLLAEEGLKSLVATGVPARPLMSADASNSHAATWKKMKMKNDSNHRVGAEPCLCRSKHLSWTQMAQIPQTTIQEA